MFWPIAAVYATLGLCALAIGLAARRYDLYMREPWYAVLAAVILGALGMRLAGETQQLMIAAVHGWGGMVSDGLLAIMAGTTEELAKLATVVLIWAALRRWFEEPNDGLVYGSFAGLGAAIEESVAILLRASPLVLPAQEPVRLAGHLIMGGIGGFGIGLLVRGAAKTTGRNAFRWIWWCFMGSMLLHTFWDVVAFGMAKDVAAGGTPNRWRTAAAIVLMLAGLIVYRSLAAVGGSLTRKALGVCEVKSRKCPN